MSLVIERYVSSLVITHYINVDFLLKQMFSRQESLNCMMNVCIKMQNKTEDKENKNQKYYTNQKSIANLFSNENHF